MKLPASAAKFSTFRGAAGSGLGQSPPACEEDLALGCECANPALQIELPETPT